MNIVWHSAWHIVNDKRIVASIVIHAYLCTPLEGNYPHRWMTVLDKIIFSFSFTSRFLMLLKLPLSKHCNFVLFFPITQLESLFVEGMGLWAGSWMQLMK